MVIYSSQRYSDNGSLGSLLDRIEMRLFGKGKFEMLMQNDSDKAAYDASVSKTKALMLAVVVAVIAVVVGVVLKNRA